MYSTYIKEFDKNIALLDEQCKKNSAFAAVVREFEVFLLPCNVEHFFLFLLFLKLYQFAIVENKKILIFNSFRIKEGIEQIKR